MCDNVRRTKLVTYASSDLGWILAKLRFAREAKIFGFDEIEIFTPKKLARLFPDFYKRHELLLRFEPRGAGFWIWKPQIVMHMLQVSSGQNDCVIYADVGTSLNPSPEAKLRLQSYVMAAGETGGFCFELENQPTAAWISGPARRFMNLSQHELIENQVCATAFGLVPNPENLKLVEAWAKICQQDQYRYLRDQSNYSEDHGFKEHRHDQAIFSVLARRASIAVFKDETYFHPRWQEDGDAFPFWATRRQSIVSMIDQQRSGSSLKLYLVVEARAVRLAKKARTLRLKLARKLFESM